MLLVAGCGRLGFDPQSRTSDATGDVASDGKPPDVTSGLAFWYTLDSLPGHDLTSNVGGNAYVASTTDVTPVAGVVNGGLHFDGVGYMGFALFPASGTMCATPFPTFANGLTVSTWVQFDTLKNWNGYTLGDFAMAQGSSGGTGGMWGLGSTNGCGPQTAGFTVAFSDAARATRCGTRVLTTGTWYLLTGVWDPVAKTLDVYVDGQLDSGAMASGSTAIASTLNPPPTCPYLAASSNQSQLLVGSLDDARVYDRPLSSAEVAQLHAHY